MSIIPELSDVDEYVQEYYNDHYEETFLDIWNNCVVLSILSVIPTVVNIITLNFGFGCLLATVIYSVFLLRMGPKNILTCANRMYREYYLIEPYIWLQIRGIVMVLVMKIISLADDIEKSNSMPNIVEYFGYTLCGANVMFGPWISFNDYLNLYKKPPKKVIFNIVIIWLIAYKEAFSFRTSHYFISYLAEAGMIASGFTNSNKKKMRFIITEPLEIEFPSSLSVVVRKWNQPMHDFLKRYVYRSWLSYATFLISSLLHGLELKISMVLVSIGVFSYLQVAPRDRIAEIFDCCSRDKR
ncbi:protein-cysteine N-palmitoyltransferase porcupine [Asbolus verrucosus]|uniref:Protein-serine O-palmitoleoyltransferase porcupine n=1 Tax=Asbolus verrucosus TaxID=1661398 RepID=A0A482W1E8_ASBVE|nr:protein-cysteine N-palmitoyltransferase porcupine [Asbolus verrucosus]